MPGPETPLLPNPSNSSSDAPPPAVAVPAQFTPPPTTAPPIAVPPSMPPAGPKRPQLPPLLVASCVLRAEWPLDGADPDQCAIAVAAIREKVKSADLAGKATKGLSSEEQETAGRGPDGAHAVRRTRVRTVALCAAAKIRDCTVSGRTGVCLCGGPHQRRTQGGAGQRIRAAKKAPPNWLKPPA